MARLEYGVLRTIITPPETCVLRAARGIPSARHCRSLPRHPMPIMRALPLPQPFPTGALSPIINRVSVASRSAAPSLIAESWQCLCPVGLCPPPHRLCWSRPTHYLMVLVTQYYTILAEYRWGKSRAQHHLSHCLVNRSSSHTQLVLPTFSYALCLAPKDDLLLTPINRHSSGPDLTAPGRQSWRLASLKPGKSQTGRGHQLR